MLDAIEGSSDGEFLQLVDLGGVGELGRSRSRGDAVSRRGSHFGAIWLDRKREFSNSEGLRLCFSTDSARNDSRILLLVRLLLSSRSLESAASILTSRIICDVVARSRREDSPSTPAPPYDSATLPRSHPIHSRTPPPRTQLRSSNPKIRTRARARRKRSRMLRRTVQARR